MMAQGEDRPLFRLLEDVDHLIASGAVMTSRQKCQAFPLVAGTTVTDTVAVSVCMCVACVIPSLREWRDMMWYNMV